MTPPDANGGGGPTPSVVLDEQPVECAVCGARYGDAEIVGLTACPRCTTQVRPLDRRSRVTVTLAWHQLRVLANWADRWRQANEDDPHWGADTSRAFERALDEIRKVRPANAPGLVLRDEVRDLQDAGHDAQLCRSDGTVLVPAPTKH